MKFWNYIGEFFLFRWLFDKFGKSTTEHDAQTKGNNRSCVHHGDYDSDYNSSGHHSSYNDWNARSYDQSFDDFHEEQDDYDMMDDDF